MLDIHGPALRTIRILTGLDLAETARRAGISRPYLAKLELGQRTRVGPRVFNALVRALGLDDRRAILARPYGACDEPDDDGDPG